MNQDRGPIKKRDNCCERGTRGMHVGTPRHQDGWLCYVPATGSPRTCTDAAFDEKFYSTTVHEPSQDHTRFPGSQRSMQMSLPMTSPLDSEIEHTGNAWPFTSAIGGLADPPIARFAQADVEELHDQDDRALQPIPCGQRQRQ
jgi:hypothetical protein